MSKFKKGDRVRCILGESGTVKTLWVTPDRRYNYNVLFDNGMFYHVNEDDLTLLSPEPASVSGEVLDPWACPKSERKVYDWMRTHYGDVPNLAAAERGSGETKIPKLNIQSTPQPPNQYYEAWKAAVVAKNKDGIQAQIDDLRDEMEEECEFRDKRIDALAARVAELEQERSERQGEDRLRKALAVLAEPRRWQKLGQGVDTVTATYSVLRHYNLYSALEVRPLQLIPYRADANMPHATRTIPQSSTPYFSPTFDSLR